MKSNKLITGGNKVVKKLLKRLVRNIVYFLVGLAVISVILLKYIVRNTVYLIIGLLGIIYIVIPNLISKVYRRIPKLVRTTIIYILVIGTIIGVYSTHNVVLANSINELNKTTIELKDNKILSLTNTNTKLSEENKSYSELKAELDKIKVENQRLRTINSLNDIERNIYNKSVAIGLTHEQSILVVSISRHETGNWKSNAFKTKNNFGGVMCNTGLKKYATFEDGLNGFVNLLKNRYFNKGLDTIEKIGAVYCPVGASNDLTGVNVHWIPNVTKYYNEYMGV